MNQTELVSAVSEAADVSKTDAAKIVSAVADAISAALINGVHVRLVGFGTFSVTSREARQGRNPRTGETITLAPSKTTKFAAGKELKGALNP